MYVFRKFFLGGLILALAAGLSSADGSSKSGSASSSKTSSSESKGSGSPNLAYKDKIIGIWEVAKSEAGAPPGMTVEFAKDGKFKITVKVDDKTFTGGGTYELDGEKLTKTIKENDKETKETDSIKTLTDKSLILVDPKGKADEFKKK